MLPLTFAALVHAVNAATITTTCADLDNVFPERIFFPGAIEYTQSMFSYFSALERELRPSCVAIPQRPEELGGMIAHIEALPGSPKVAIKGGGHTAWAGSANIEDGILIDMQGFKGVHIHPEKGTVTIGAGERWGSVYSALESHGLAVAGGRVERVGVGGFILGGGISFFSEQIGFVCDQVVNFEVVLASGKIVQANKNENSDLFKALKGGGNNFGVMTAFEIPTFPNGKMWGGTIAYPTSAWEAAVDKLCTWAESPDKFGHLFVNRFYTGILSGVTVGAISSNTTEVSPVLKSYTEIQPQLFSTVREDTLLGMARELSKYTSDGLRHAWYTTSFRVSKPVLMKAVKLYEDAVEELKPVFGISLFMVAQPLTKQMLIESGRAGPNALGLQPDDGPLILFAIDTVHLFNIDDEKVNAVVQGLLKRVEEVAVQEGVASKYRFLNYAYKGTPVLEGYGAASVAELKAMSKKYDPTRFFQDRVPGGFKLWAVPD